MNWFKKGKFQMGEFDAPEEVEEKYKEVVIEIGKQQNNIKHQLRSKGFLFEILSLTVFRGEQKQSIVGCFGYYGQYFSSVDE